MNRQRMCSNAQVIVKGKKSWETTANTTIIIRRIKTIANPCKMSSTRACASSKTESRL